MSDWIEGPPVEPGVYVCQSDVEAQPRFWLATVYDVKGLGLEVRAVLSHAIAGGDVRRTSLDWFADTHRITHHQRIEPKRPER